MSNFSKISTLYIYLTEKFLLCVQAYIYLFLFFTWSTPFLHMIMHHAILLCIQIILHTLFIYFIKDEEEVK